MKNFKKLGATLFLIAVATVGVGLTAQSARANCLAPIMVIDYNTNETREGFISCGSTAGNYVGFRDGSSVTDETIDFLCATGVAC